MHITPEHKFLFYKATTTTILAAGSLYTPWETTKIIGSTILTGIGYGVVNELISSLDCSKHFDKKHISDSSHLRNQPIQGLHSSLNAVVSGMFDYWSVSSISGIILAVVARASLPILKVKINATQIIPYLVIGSSIVTLIVQIGNRILRKYSDNAIACNIQHAVSYGILVTGNIVLTTAILTTRIGLFRLIK
ncbi:MAG: hypothetical protein C5B45_01035 [Chlamydiae bacterium]|nr:MAG: hypothetical protein C5B45_01035 [Chlamydiota bacterium]